MANQGKDDGNLTLDKRKFAEMVVMSQNIPNDLDPETIVKQKLTLYLSAYYLAERFNKLEGAHFEGEISTDHYQKLMQQLKDDKFGDW
ncbi:hypothetical protein [Lactiplantibacillus herbarum]|uniref:hypothetical protein n=1 Tax=Lactiplantibacillus herbarum TaxID=1670446 RepID=UPI00064FDA37|nr:hypothetical protein [Lactiplantibacillus herbarum]